MKHVVPELLVGLTYFADFELFRVLIELRLVETYEVLALSMDGLSYLTSAFHLAELAGDVDLFSTELFLQPCLEILVYKFETALQLVRICKAFAIIARDSYVLDEAKVMGNLGGHCLTENLLHLGFSLLECLLV